MSSNTIIKNERVLSLEEARNSEESVGVLLWFATQTFLLNIFPIPLDISTKGGLEGSSSIPILPTNK